MTRTTGRITAAPGLRLAALAAVLLGGVPAAFAQDAAALTDPSVPLGKAVPGFNYAALQGNGAIAGAAEYQGWTVLRVAPDQTLSEKQPAQ